MDQRIIEGEGCGTGCNGNNHGVRRKPDQVAADSVTPQAIGQDTEALEQFKVEGRIDAAADVGVALDKLFRRSAQS